jgi:hypothetical protein
MAAYGGGVQRRIARQRAELETVLRYGVGTTEYMRTTGGYALTLECGQHVDPQAPEVAYRAIINTLAFLKLIDAPEPEPVPFDEMEALQMVVVHDKQDAGDQFIRAWASFRSGGRGRADRHARRRHAGVAEFRAASCSRMRRRRAPIRSRSGIT